MSETVLLVALIGGQIVALAAIIGMVLTARGGRTYSSLPEAPKVLYLPQAQESSELPGGSSQEAKEATKTLADQILAEDDTNFVEA